MRFGGRVPETEDVVFGPTRVDHDGVGAATRSGVQAGEHSVVNQFGPRPPAPERR